MVLEPKVTAMNKTGGSAAMAFKRCFALAPDMKSIHAPYDLDVKIDEGSLINGAEIILATIRPAWTKEKVNFKIFTDGITNKLVGCFHDDSPDDVVLVRVYGEKTDMLIDRTSETRNIQFLHEAGYAPQLYATFSNGLAYEYVPGEILSVDMCRDPAIYPLVASMMARIHQLDCGPDIPRAPVLWKKTQQFMSIMPKHFEDKDKQARFEKTIPSRIELEKEYTELHSELSHLGSPVVYCHNDLLLANVIYNSKDSKVTFIDYEYANYNYQAFDIGNHFAEFAGVTEVDYTRYPSFDFQREWLQVYLKTFKDSNSIVENDSSSEVSEEEVNKLLLQVSKFSLASHFFWAIWGLIQSEHSKIDFDFLGYAAVRLNEYFSRKKTFLSLDITSL